MLGLRTLINISRPRFRVYIAGPFVVGVAASGFFTEMISYITDAATTTDIRIGIIVIALFLVLLDYFFFGANLLIYGVNDIADGDTDQYNEKKQSYETILPDNYKKSLSHSIVGWHVIYIVIIVILITVLMFITPPSDQGSAFIQSIFVTTWRKIVLLFGIFQGLSLFYSLPPIRAKAHAGRDSLFQLLYIIPGIIGYVSFGGEISSINWFVIAAAWLWCVAMHAYSAIPDINADKQAGLQTTAIYLGKYRTLVYCGIFRLAAILLIYPILGGWAFLLGVPYIIMIILSFFCPVFTLYKLFPRINAVVGFVLFRLVFV